MNAKLNYKIDVDSPLVIDPNVATEALHSPPETAKKVGSALTATSWGL